MDDFKTLQKLGSDFLSLSARFVYTESKLHQVKSGTAMIQSISKPDSGYSSSFRTTASPSSLDIRRLQGLVLDEEEGDDLRYGIEETGGDESELMEGQALLGESESAVTTAQWRHLRGLGEEDGCNRSSEDGERSASTSPSHSYFRVTPPTPASPKRLEAAHSGEGGGIGGMGENEEEHEDQQDEDFHGLAFDSRRPANASFDTGSQSRRISFNSSVRISGGIKGSKPHRHSRPLPPDLFSPSAPLTSIPSPLATERSRLIPTGTTPPSSRSYLQRTATSNSRNSSPNSSAFHTRNPSTGSLYPHHSGYSSTATSAVPSRSSSPCSSIYAPLQPPSATCPSPINARPPIKKAPGRPLTFREYLRGRRDDSDEENGKRGYKALLDVERRRKAKAEHRKLKGKSRVRSGSASSLGELEREPSVWGWFLELLSSSAASVGPRGGMIFIPPSGAALPPSYSGFVRKGKRSVANGEDDRKRQRSIGRGSPPEQARGKRVRRKTSSLSHSSLSDDADDESENGGPVNEDSDIGGETRMSFNSWATTVGSILERVVRFLGSCFAVTRRDRGLYQNV